MKKYVVIAGVAVLMGGLACSYPALACSGHSGDAPSGNAPAQHAARHDLHGKIVSVNSGGMVVEVNEKNKQTKNVNVTFGNHVQVALNGKASSVAQLAIGDYVDVQGPETDATKVSARTPHGKTHSG